MSVPYHDLSRDPGLLVTLHEPDARLQHVPEAVLQDLWAQRLFRPERLRTLDGQELHVLDPGRLNTDGGADFTAARVRIGETEWAGDVEIHRTPGEWVLHRHGEDPRYDRVVLHVALAPDRHAGTLRRSDGTALPELLLMPHLAVSLREHLWRFFAHPAPAFACERDWPAVPASVRAPWLRRLGLERLRGLAERLAGSYQRTADAEEGLWRATLRALGYAPNADAMERLARRVPLRRLRTLEALRDAEALLLHAAGLLPPERALPHGDAETLAYARELRGRAAAIAADVPPLPTHTWQFARLRPANQPARRLAQAAALAAPGGWLHRDPFGEALAALDASRPWPALRRLLTDARPDPYWVTHTRVETRCRPLAEAIGRERAEAILLHAVLPALLLTAEAASDEALAERITQLYLDRRGSSDRVTRRYTAEPPDALATQGLHRLARHYCGAGRCLSCAVGRHLLSVG